MPDYSSSQGSHVTWASPFAVFPSIMCLMLLSLCHLLLNSQIPWLFLKRLAIVRNGGGGEVDKGKNWKNKETQHTPMRMTKMQNSLSTKCWGGCGATGALIHCWWECKWVQLPWKTVWQLIFEGGSDGEESACTAGDPGLIPGSGRYPGEGNGNPVQNFCLEHSVNRGAWRTTVHRVTKSQTWLID